MKFSIILPVKNGGNYIKECVSSILAQTYHDFNLHILENCSNDGTAEWLQTINDKRVIVLPSEKSLTIEENWSRILTIDRNEFMTMIGHDDWLDENFLEVMNNLIETHPSASLYHAHFRLIDAEGKVIRKCKPMKRIETGAEYLKSVMLQNIDFHGTGYILRSKDYDKLGGIPASYFSLLFSDLHLWINTSSISYKVTSLEECFAFRLHQSTGMTASDIKIYETLEQFTHFIQSLRNRGNDFDRVVEQHAIRYIQIWCRGLAHRLLRTPKLKRQNMSVEYLLAKSKHWANVLLPVNDFTPTSDRSVKLALLIDKFSLTRKSFLLFKKIYAKPILPFKSNFY